MQRLAPLVQTNMIAPIIGVRQEKNATCITCSASVENANTHRAVRRSLRDRHHKTWLDGGCFNTFIATDYARRFEPGPYYS